MSKIQEYILKVLEEEVICLFLPISSFLIPVYAMCDDNNSCLLVTIYYYYSWTVWLTLTNIL